MPAIRRSVLLSAALLVVTVNTGSEAMPLAPGVMRELTLITDIGTCNGGPNNQSGSMICASTQDGTLVTPTFASAWGGSVRATAAALNNGFDVSITAISLPNVDIGQGTVTAVQFDTLTISGPTPNVLMGVTVEINGTTTQQAPTFVLTAATLTAGVRNPAPNPNLSTRADRIASNSWVIASGRSATLLGGVIAPIFHRQETNGFLASVGSPFEYGFEFVVDSQNTAMNFQARVTYSLPEGYSMTSARGLAVNTPPVPEPTAWMTFLAGLAAIGLLRARHPHCRREAQR